MGVEHPLDSGCYREALRFQSMGKASSVAAVVVGDDRDVGGNVAGLGNGPEDSDPF